MQGIPPEDVLFRVSNWFKHPSGGTELKEVGAIEFMMGLRRDYGNFQVAMTNLIKVF